jgi:hypothetical protein
MSYARFGDDSDVFVYVYEDKNKLDNLVCANCKISPDGYTTESIPDMITHLEKHKTLGYKVPDYTIESLEFEYEVYGELRDHEKNGYYDNPNYCMGLPFWLIVLLWKLPLTH